MPLPHDLQPRREQAEARLCQLHREAELARLLRARARTSRDLWQWRLWGWQLRLERLGAVVQA